MNALDGLSLVHRCFYEFHPVDSVVFGSSSPAKKRSILCSVFGNGIKIQSFQPKS